jgi:CheY-like chemotaxis protein
VARVLLLTADLLFGSNVAGGLGSAGHEVELVADGPALRDALLREAAAIVTVDLTTDELQRVQSVRELREEGFIKRIPVLAYYSHVEPGVRELALAEGFDLVVPRSRMAREGSELVEQLLSTA